MTFRFQGHVFGDADAYMAPGREGGGDGARPGAALPRVADRRRRATDSELAALEAAIEREIDEAVAFALDSPLPDVAELRRDVFAEEMAA